MKNKIDYAIEDVEFKIKKVDKEIELKILEKKVLMEELGTLEKIKRSPVYSDEISKKDVLEFINKVKNLDKSKLEEEFSKILYETFNFKIKANETL